MNENPIEAILVDATENHIERPKKTKKILFGKEKEAYSKNSNFS